MRILSVNQENTVDDYNVAFNVDEPPREKLVGRIRYGTLGFRYSNGVLSVRASEEGSPIGAIVVNNINKKIAHEESAMAAEDARELEKRTRMLERVGANTGLPLA